MPSQPTARCALARTSAEFPGCGGGDARRMVWARTGLRAQANLRPTPAWFRRTHATGCRFQRPSGPGTQGPWTCEPGQCCPDTAGGRNFLTVARGGAGGGIGAGRCLQPRGSGNPKRPSGPPGARPERGPQVDAMRDRGPIGGFRGVVPPGETASLWRRRLKGAEDRATPGGYGGKPPGVAFIGVPTGARNAGRCSDGGPEHRFECYYDSPHDASNPEHIRGV